MESMLRDGGFLLSNNGLLELPVGNHSHSISKLTWLR